MEQPVEFGRMVIDLGGGLALFLYGMHRMTSALQVIAGEQVRDVLAKLTTNRFSAAFAGAAVTAVIQSSSITTVLLVGFITAGLMTFPQSIGVILGANVGTTITAQIIAFRITDSALFLIGVGFFTELLARHPRLKQFGVMAMGLGLLFFGMELMSQATGPLRSYAPFMAFMQEMRNPLLALGVGAGFTALVQSSSATTGIVIVMAGQGLLTLETGIAVILGSNIGTCFTAVLSALGKPRAALQAATAHVLFNVIGALLFVPFIPQLAELVRQGSSDLPRQIANAHTAFNVVNLLLFIGFTGALARLVLRLVPDRPAEAVPGTVPEYLDKLYLGQPAVALDRVGLELTRVGDKVVAMIRDSYPTLTVGSRERVDALEARDHEIDSLTDAILRYLRQLSTGDLVGSQPARLQRYLGAANYLENIGDVIETGVVPDARKRLDSGHRLSGEASRDIEEIYRELYQTAQRVVVALAEDDREEAAAVLNAKGHFNGLVERARGSLYARLRSGMAETLALYKIELSTIEHYRRVHNVLRRICKLVIGQEQAAGSETPAPGNDAGPPAATGA